MFAVISNSSIWILVFKYQGSLGASTALKKSPSVTWGDISAVYHVRCCSCTLTRMFRIPSKLLFWATHWAMWTYSETVTLKHKFEMSKLFLKNAHPGFISMWKPAPQEWNPNTWQAISEHLGHIKYLLQEQNQQVNYNEAVRTLHAVIKSSLPLLNCHLTT